MTARAEKGTQQRRRWHGRQAACGTRQRSGRVACAGPSARRVGPIARRAGTQVEQRGKGRQLARLELRLDGGEEAAAEEEERQQLPAVGTLERVTKQLGEETKAEARRMLLLCARDGACMLLLCARDGARAWGHAAQQ